MAVINLREPIMAQRFVPVACPFQALEQSKLDGVFLRMPPTFRKQLLNMLLVQEVSRLIAMHPGQLCKLMNFVMVWIVMHSIDGRAHRIFHRPRNCLIGYQHELLNQLVAFVVFIPPIARCAPKLVQFHPDLREIEIQGPFREPAPPQDPGQRPTFVEKGFYLIQDHSGLLTSRIKDSLCVVVGQSAM